MLKIIEFIGQYIKNFRSNETAAVTVDWVVLTAAIVAMVVFLIQQLTLPVEAVSTAVAEGIQQFGS